MVKKIYVMKYDDILGISLKLLENDEFKLTKPTILYELDKKAHHDLDLELFNNMNVNGKFTHSEIINLTLNGIKFMFIEKDKKLFVE